MCDCYELHIYVDPKRIAASFTTTAVDSSITCTEGSVIDTVLGSRVLGSGTVEEPMNSSSRPIGANCGSDVASCYGGPDMSCGYTEPPTSSNVYW